MKKIDKNWFEQKPENSSYKSRYKSNQNVNRSMAVEHINELVNPDDLVQVRTKGIGFTD
jgi:hypothetical protein